MVGTDASDLTVVIGALLAAGGPRRFAAASMFPLHEAVRGLYADPDSRHVPGSLMLTRAPDVGLAVEGMPEALYGLLLDEVLLVEVLDGQPYFCTDPDRLRTSRRWLMGLEPSVAASYRRTATAWTTRCSSLMKT